MIPAEYIDKDKFTTPGNQINTFVNGRLVKADCGDDGYKVCTVARSQRVGGGTLVILAGQSDLLTRKLVSVEVGTSPAVNNYLISASALIGSTVSSGVGNIINNTFLTLEEKIDSIIYYIQNQPEPDPNNTIVSYQVEYTTPPIGTPFVTTETETITTDQGTTSKVVDRNLRAYEWAPTAGGYKLFAMPTGNTNYRLPYSATKR